jgi:hypothetical protein
MKKHIISLGALALAIGTINFVGCDAPPELDPTVGEKGVEMSEEDKAAAKKEGYNAGPEGGSQAGDGGGKKED